MKRKSILWGLFSGLAMLVLILDGKTALDGARQGVMVCLMTVIPALFPFFLLSGLLTAALMGAPAKGLAPLGRLLGLPKGAGALAVPTLLGGYPAGAGAVAEGYRSGMLSKKQAEKLLPVCNQPGPAFLFGMVGMLFPKGWMAWALWGIVVVSAGVTALVTIPRAEPLSLTVSGKVPTPAGAMADAVKAMGSVCGWVVLFRVLLAFLTRWCLWLVPETGQVAIVGLLELSNGALRLAQILDVRTRFCLAAGMVSFGGLCVTMQTHSLAGELSLKPYLAGKLLQAMVAVCLSLGFFLPVVGLAVVFPRMRQKRGSISPAVGV